MKKLPLSKFDLAMIIAFVVIGLLGGGVIYYLGGVLTEAQQAATQAKTDFDHYSVQHTTKQDILVSSRNQGVLKNNIDILKGQLVPLIDTKLQAKDNKLNSLGKKDPVAWKHDLDEEVRRLTAAAGVHSVTLPANFYFAFSNYVSSNPADDQTQVLSKQLFVIEQITNILINAPVRSILDIQRTYEENARSGNTPPPPGNGPGGQLPGSSYQEGDAYRVYPFQFEFETSAGSFRKIMNDLLQSPYVFVVRSVTVANSQTVSPTPADLDRIAGSPGDTPSVTTTDPGTVGATHSTLGPQYLFGNQTLHVKIRIDLIDWSTPAPN